MNETGITGQSRLTGKLVWAVVFCLAFLVQYVFALLNLETMRFIFVNFTFYILLFASLLWAWSIVKFLRQAQIVNFWKANADGLLISLVITAFIFIAIKPQFRILADEANLQSLGQSFLYFKKALTIKNAMIYGGSFKVLANAFPYTPTLTSFFACLLHTVLGYSPKNIFVLNFILCFLIVFMVFSIGRKVSPYFAIVAVLLFVAQPVIPLCFTSGGYEPLFTFFLILTLYLTYLYLKEPSESLFLLLFMTGMLMANTRPEAVVLVFVIFAFLLVFRKLRLSDMLPNSLFLAATPLLLMPLVFQRIYFDSKFPGQFMGVPFNARTIDGRFSPAYLWPNIKVVILALFNFTYQYPYANILLIGSLLLTPWLFRHLRNTAPKPVLWSVSLAAIVVLAHFILLMFFFTGEFNSPVTHRLFITWLIYSSLICAYFIAVKVRERFCGIAIAAAIFLLYYPVAVRACVDQRIPFVIGTRFAWEFIEKEAVRNTDLIIAKAPVNYTMKNTSAVDFEYANAEWNHLKIWQKAGLFGTIYVIQECDRKSDTIDPSTALPNDPDYTLTPLDKIMISDNQSIVISRLHPAAETTERH